MNRVFVLLPKLSSYQYKLDQFKAHYRDIIYSEVQSFIDAGITPVFLREDMLAITLFGDSKDVEWCTCYNQLDFAFMKSDVKDYPELYLSIKLTQEIDKNIDKTLVEKCKFKSIKDCKGDRQEYSIGRINSLTSKLRLGANLIAKRYSGVLQFIDGNNYCEAIEPVVGDGKLITTVYLNSSTKTVHYGGCAIEQDMVHSILEVI